MRHVLHSAIVKPLTSSPNYFQITNVRNFRVLFPNKLLVYFQGRSLLPALPKFVTVFKFPLPGRTHFRARKPNFRLLLSASGVGHRNWNRLTNHPAVIFGGECSIASGWMSESTFGDIGSTNWSIAVARGYKLSSVLNVLKYSTISIPSICTSYSLFICRVHSWVPLVVLH